MRFSTAVTSIALTGAVSVSALNQLTISGRHFYDSVTKQPFFVRGVDYQPGGSSGFKGKTDPLTDVQGLARDIYLFQKLGINTIRVYSVDPTANHDEAMTMLNAAGIYVVLDVNTPLEKQHLNAVQPWTTYTSDYLTHVYQVLEVFGPYDNLLGVLAGNEVVFEPESVAQAPRYVKAVVRDIKSYMKKNMPNRQIPVGYAHGDVLEYRVSFADYMQCGDESEVVDFFGVNSYQWCGPDATFETSGYNTLVDDFQNYSIPLFFTEYGCNKPAPRAFNEVPALYSNNMTGVFSGGLVYQYNQDSNDYGLVDVDKSTGTATWNNDFDTLTTKFAGLAAPSIPSDEQKNTRPTTCKGPFPNINGTDNLPVTINQTLIDKGIPGSGSVWNAGKFLSKDQITTKTKYQIINAQGKTVANAQYNDNVVNATGGGTGGSSSGDSGNKKNAATSAFTVSSSLYTAVFVGVAAMFFL